MQRGAATSVLLKNVFDASVSAVLWWATGYGLAYGQDSFGETGTNGFIGTSGFFYQGEGSGSDGSPLTTTPEAKTYGKASFMFHWAFAAVATTIVSGAVAERCNMTAYACYSVAMTGFIYPLVVHLAWNVDGYFSALRKNRLFAGCGVIDFAGSGVVHFCGGVAALVAATCFMPRAGRFNGHLKLHDLNIIFQTLGVLLLWIGWYAFNCGSVQRIVSTKGADGTSHRDGGGLVAHVAFTTTLSAGAGCLGATLWSYIFGERNVILNAKTINNGILAGLVSVTAGWATINGYAALLIGFVGSGVFYAASKIVEYFLIDDVVDAFAVHGACGFWGIIAAALFSTEYFYSITYIHLGDDTHFNRKDKCAGVFYGGDGSSLLAAVAFLAFVGCFVAGCMKLLLLAVDFILQTCFPLQYPLGIALICDEFDDFGTDDTTLRSSDLRTAAVGPYRDPTSDELDIELTDIPPLSFSARTGATTPQGGLDDTLTDDHGHVYLDDVLPKHHFPVHPV